MLSSSEAAERGHRPIGVRLEHNAGFEREPALLRGLAALGTAAAAIPLAVLPFPWAARVAGALGLVVSLLWGRALLRGRRRERASRGQALAIDVDAVTLHGPGGAERVPWDAVLAIDADEEKLLIRVVTRDGADLLLEPAYGDLGLHELAALLEAHRAAHLHAAPTPPPSAEGANAARKP